MILQTHDIDHVVLAFTADHEAGLDVVRVCNELGVQVDIVPRLFEVVGSRAGVYSLEGTPLLGLTPPELGASHRLAKRTMDVAGAIFGLVVLSPVFLATAIAIRVNSTGPVFFRQTRIGRGQQPFTIIKFRTMVRDAEQRKAEVAHLNAHRDSDARMFKIPDDPRVTSVGGFLRRYSIDEFPQLWNVLRGQMSLVGPAAADPARASVRERLGPAPARPDARPHRPVAGLRPKRGHVLADAGAGLPVRDELEPLGRYQAHHAHRPRADGQDSRRPLGAPDPRGVGAGIARRRGRPIRTPRVARTARGAAS